jgi:hypothetical protein
MIENVWLNDGDEVVYKSWAKNHYKNMCVPMEKVKKTIHKWKSICGKEKDVSAMFVLENIEKELKQ